MSQIEAMFGPFSNEEINFYKKRLSEDSSIKNEFQADLVKNLFLKYFGEPNAINPITNEDYIKLVIAAKRILIANKFVVLPYIISSKIRNIQNRKSINKKEAQKIYSSQYYPEIVKKYNSPKMIDYILSLLATINSTEFTFIDYDDPELDGKTVQMIPDIVYEEILIFILMI